MNESLFVSVKCQVSQVFLLQTMHEFQRPTKCKFLNGLLKTHKSRQTIFYYQTFLKKT